MKRLGNLRGLILLIFWYEVLVESLIDPSNSSGLASNPVCICPNLPLVEA
jgi:hypothetical protein